jgi:hypothetical protein
LAAKHLAIRVCVLQRDSAQIRKLFRLARERDGARRPCPAGDAIRVLVAANCVAIAAAADDAETLRVPASGSARTSSRVATMTRR